MLFLDTRSPDRHRLGGPAKQADRPPAFANIGYGGQAGQSRGGKVVAAIGQVVME